MESCFRAAFRIWINSDESRNPGRTVTYAAKHRIADKNSYARGAIMRIAPVAIYAQLKGYSVHQTAELAYRIANFRHGPPLATFPAVESAIAPSACGGHAGQFRSVDLEARVREVLGSIAWIGFNTLILLEPEV